MQSLFFEYCNEILGICRMDGTWVDINQKWTDILGWSKTEIMSQNFSVLLHPDDLAPSNQAMSVLGKGEAIDGFVNRYRTRDGRYVHLRWTARTALVDQETLIYCAAQDVEAAFELQESLDSQVRLSKFVGNSSKIGGWEYDVATQKLTWTSETFRIYGVESRDFKPTLISTLSFYAPEYRATRTEALARLQENGKDFDIELQLIRADGERLWVRKTGSGEFSNGSLVRINGTIHDINLLKNAENERDRDRITLLQAREEAAWYRSCTNAAAIVAITDPQGRITHVNEKFENISGYSSDELIGKTHAVINSSYHPKDFFQDLWKSINNGENWRGEICNKAKDGSLYWVDTTIIPLKEGKGKILRHVAIRFDITQRKNLEQQNLLQAQLQSLLLELTPVGIYRTAPDGSCHFVNHEWLRITGLSAAEAMGYGWVQSIHPDDRTFLSQAWQEFTEGRRSFELSYRFLRPNGDMRWVNGQAIAVRDENGQVQGYLGTINDITELQKTQEELRRSSAAKTMFLANISHEIRTPLNAILGISQLMTLAETNPNSAQLANLQDIQNSGELLLSIINDVLDLSKIEAGNLQIESKSFDLLKLINSTLNLVKAANTKDTVKLTSSFASNLPRWVLGDETRIKQILLNFLSNAMKFTENGVVDFSVELDPSQINPLSHKLLFSIRDSGIGMSSEQIARLFKPFSQADSSITRRFGGTGLGLAISKRLCEMMSGQIQVESELGKGSCFKMLIALQISEMKTEPLDPTSLLANHSRLRCLVVEDNLINQKIAVGMLKKFGISASIADNGLIAVENCKNQIYDVIFMDLQMPFMGGLEATQKIRTETLCKNAWIIALTANAFDEDKKICLESGMNAFVSKPIRMQELQTSLANVPNSAGNVA